MNISNGIRILRDIEAVPDGANCAIILRHADRDGELNQVVRRDEGLNEIGIMRSRELGSSLTHFKDMSAYSSPIGRCLDTCVHISEGYGRRTLPKSTELLGMSAPFMVDTKRAYEKMKEVGLLGFVDLYVNDMMDRSIALPCSEGLRMLLSYAIDKIAPMNNGLGIFVTHDMIITPPMAYYFGYDFHSNGLVPFLDGLVLYQTEEGFVARYNGAEMKVGKDGTPKGRKFIFS